MKMVNTENESWYEQAYDDSIDFELHGNRSARKNISNFDVIEELIMEMSKDRENRHLSDVQYDDLTNKLLYNVKSLYALVDDK